MVTRQTTKKTGNYENLDSSNFEIIKRKMDLITYCGSFIVI
jgi:hypothetical protein